MQDNFQDILFGSFLKIEDIKGKYVAEQCEHSISTYGKNRLNMHQCTKNITKEYTKNW